MINRSELIRDFSTKYGYKQYAVTEFLDHLGEYMTDQMMEGEQFVIYGLGTIGLKEREGKEGTHPATGERYYKKPDVVPFVRFGASFKKKIKDAFPNGKIE